MRKLLSALLVLLVLAYIGFQVSSNLTEQIETINAQMVTVEDKTICEGLFIRSSNVVTGDTSKSYEVLVENGEKVSGGQEIIAFFDSASGAENYRKSIAMKKDIANTEEAYKNIMGDNSGALLDGRIFDSMQSITTELSNGKVWATDELYSTLTQAVIAREYPKDEIEGLRTAINGMKAELKVYQNAAASSRTLKADRPGYFVRASESSETLVKPSEMLSLTPDSLSALLASGNTKEGGAGEIGYILDTFDWYFVCTVASDEGYYLESRGSVNLSFPNISSQYVNAAVYKVAQFDDKALVYFRCSNMEEGFLNGQIETVEIIKSTYSGIKIPREAVHYEDNKWGVFCLTGAVVEFKEVKWIYQGDTFYVAEQAESSKKGIYLYDKIITKGKDLKVNMVVK